MHSIWTVQTGHNLGTLQEKVATTINLPVSGADTITKIAGTIPPGLRLSGTTITGSPFQVSRNSTFEFCLRAREAGFDVWVDPNLRIGHEKTKIL